MQSFKITETQKITPFVYKGQENEDEELWLILSKNEFQKYHKFFQWQPQTIRACLGTYTMPQVEVYEEYDFGILQRLVWIGGELTTRLLCFYISSHYLILVVEEDTQWINEFCASLIEDDKQKYTVGYIFFRLLDNIIQSDQNYLDRLSEEIQELEENVFNEVSCNFAKEMIHIRKHLTILERHYDPLTDIIEDFVGNENKICNKEAIRYFKIIKNRMRRLNHQVNQLGEYATHVREANDAQIEIKQNRIMQYFTLIASIVLPLTLITGWYGMNFEHIPELAWKFGYLYVIIISVVSSVLCVYAFKKNKWM